MGKNFIEASTEIDGLVFQKNEITKKISNTVAAAILDRVNNNKLSGLSKDIDNLIKDLSDPEKYQVMLLVSIILAKNVPNKSKNTQDANSTSRRNLFDRF